MRIPSKIEKDDDHDRRLRLVKLAYEVLRDMKTPDDATDVEMLSLLSRAFSDRSTVPETPQARTAKPALTEFAPRFARQTPTNIL
jgi:hypothetical protein